MSREQELAVITEAIAAGEATPAQRARWAQLTADQPQSARDLRDEVALTLRLRALLAQPDEHLADRVLDRVASDQLSSPMTTADRRSSRRTRRHSRRGPVPGRFSLPVLLTLAAGLVLATALLLVRQPSAAPTQAAYAQLERSDETSVVAIDGQAMSGRGRPIHAGARLQVTSGQAQIAFSDGSAVILSPGSELTLGPDAPGKTLHLHTGRVETVVAPQPIGRPLRITTAQAELTVLGTAFTLSVDADRTLVEMRSGRVSLTGSQRSQSLVLEAGDRAEVRTDGVPSLVVTDPRPRGITILPLADGFTEVREPELRKGTDPVLAVKAGTSDQSQRTRHIHLRFQLDPVPERIEKAELLLEAVVAGDPTRHALHATSGAWDETTLSWDDSPTLSGPAIAIWPVSQRGSIRIDVTAAVRDHQAGIIDWCIVGHDEVGPGGMWAYASREYPKPAARPQLVVTLPDPD